ncbi:MAG: hypothetical protein ACJA0K_002935 [Maricaulis maris]|jgi:uncharacterized protein (DUF885 family)|uniref:DUF885 domain-containing protein n=1 Tax=Maricaulis maris (strain MCS10) TaxID=394221 RepID=Q0ANB1_MARMM|nr:DUF885 domain-containing protein [Maricaulis maris]ABI66226.1 protein of unknown function DUF885 [Maricaulis maris MCS10]
MTRLQNWLAAASILAIAAACSPPTAAPATDTSPVVETEAAPTPVEQTESQRLYAWYSELFEADLARSPQQQTGLGRIDDLDAYGRWDDVSDAAAEAAQQRRIDRLAYMRENFDFDALDRDASVSWRVFEYLQETGIRQFEFRDQTYVFTQMFGPHTGLPSTLIGQHRVENADHAEAYISRLNGIGPVLDTLIARADARAEAGVIPPRFAFEYLIGNTGAVVTGAPFDDSEAVSPLLADFTAKVEALDIDDDAKADLIARGTTALTDVVGPAYGRLIAMFERHEAMTDERDGAWKLPRGEAYYQSQLAAFTTLPDLSPQEVHDTGLAEIERIHGEMRGIMEQVGFEGSLQDFFEFMRTDEQFYYPSTPEGRARYIAEVSDVFDRVRGIIPDYFDTVPQGEMIVREVEAYRAAGSPTAFYNTGSLDGARPGIYYANTLNMRNLPVYQMETLAYHEGIPGHHFQLTLAQEQEGTPMFQRFLYLSAFGEGWALYAESLGKDMGMFDDPYQDFGRLAYELWRAGRLVVDTGIHSLQWSREDAIDYLRANTSFTEEEITREVERYIVWPGQATSYKTGQMRIRQLRDFAQAELGDAFDYGEFHDVVLTNGSLPLAVLTALVNDYVDEKRTEASE